MNYYIAQSRECDLNDATNLSKDGLRDDGDDNDDVLVSSDRRLVTTVLATPGSTFIYFLSYAQRFFPDNSCLRISKKFHLNCRVARRDQSVLKLSAYSQQLLVYTTNMKCDIQSMCRGWRGHTRRQTNSTCILTLCAKRLQESVIDVSSSAQARYAQQLPHLYEL